jgi:hypothetical protein
MTFGIAEMLGSAVLRSDPLWPIQAAASLIMHEQAFDARSVAIAIPIGLMIHFSLVVTYGFVYGLASSDARLATRLDARREVVGGALFGAGIWLLNFQLVARAFYPWLFATNQLMQVVTHAVGFGVVLALLLRRKELRRVGLLRRPNQHA